MQIGARIAGGLVALAGTIALVLAPLIGDVLFTNLWGLEPLIYIGMILLTTGAAIVAFSYVIPTLLAGIGLDSNSDKATIRRWSQVTQQYFELFDHDLGRPLRRILGKERELRAILQSSGTPIDPAVKELFDEIERQTPNFRLMMSNIQVLVQLEHPNAPLRLEAVEPSEVTRKIIDRYSPVAAEGQSEITWWSEPTEFGIVLSDTSAIEHIVTNLVDNAVRYANTHVEVKLTKNPSHFFVRVWDDGPGIAPNIFSTFLTAGGLRRSPGGKKNPAQGLDYF